eukprot:99526-Chlamydomonas_euryale.AAC.2
MGAWMSGRQRGREEVWGRVAAINNTKVALTRGRASGGTRSERAPIFRPHFLTQNQEGRKGLLARHRCPPHTRLLCT